MWPLKHVRVALGLAEQFLGQVLIARQVHAVLPAQPGWQRLPAAPVQAISGLPAQLRPFARMTMNNKHDGVSFAPAYMVLD